MQEDRRVQELLPKAAVGRGGGSSVLLEPGLIEATCSLSEGPQDLPCVGILAVSCGSRSREQDLYA
jgi:hypothetical protein